ncbi:MAG: ABC transporter permease [Micrococcales bacterium]
MLKFIVKRVANGFLMLFAVSFLAYFLMFIGSGNVARLLLGLEATPEQIAQKNHELGLDRSFFEQYFSWLGGAVKLDLGTSWSLSEGVSAILFPRLAITLQIVTLTTIIAAVAAIILGTLAALYGGWIDRAVQFFGLLGFAVPGFLVAFFLAAIFAIQLPWFNAVGYTQFSEDPYQWFRSVTLPVLALSFSGLAAAAQQVRGSVKDALEMDYVRTLRARGLSFSRVVFKHVLRNAAGPALSIIGVQFVGMIGGAILVEQIFAIPGLGPFAVSSTALSDIPSIMGLVVVTAMLVIVMNLIVDLLSAALNPKVRLS